MRAHHLRLLAEQNLRAAELSYLIQQVRGAATFPTAISPEDQVLFTHPDLIDLDLADAYWRP